MALPDPSDGAPDSEEQDRRFALLKTYFGAFLIAGLVGLPGWFHSAKPDAFGLSVSLVPAAISSCLLVALSACIPEMYPFPKLTPLVAVACAAMHVMAMSAFATVLIVRPDAMMELPPQMEPLARWSAFPIEMWTFLAEAFGLAAFAFAAARRPTRGDHP